MKILIADDEIVSRRTLETFTRQMGYQVFCAENGSDAWEIWQSHKPQIVITDRHMPGMDGLDLCRKIREHDQDGYTYIIMVTALDDQEIRMAGKNAGADNFFTKPFSKAQLEILIKTGEKSVQVLQNRIKT